MAKQQISKNVLEAAVDRLYKVYSEGHRVIVSFSGGKDSGVTVELAIMAAKAAGRLPVEVIMRDDEILYPGTFEYAERVYNRPEVKMHWVSARQAQANVFNRQIPYFWVFDKWIPQEQWVRQPPPFIEWDEEGAVSMYYMVNPTKYPAERGKKLVSVVGIRTTESQQRLFAILSSRGARSYAPKDKRMFNLYPIYDWDVGDIWKAVKDNHWDYNEAYDVLGKMGVPASKQRISLVAMSAFGIDTLRIASRAWPRWFDKVSERLKGIRQVIYYGEKVLMPVKRQEETWEECFNRTCLGNNTPSWIKERAAYVQDRLLTKHASHSEKPFPEIAPCRQCGSNWKHMTLAMFTGDPFSLKFTWLPYLEPNFFRPEDTRIWPKNHFKKEVRG